MPSSSPILAVFFDLDDTLCDTIGTREARARLAFEALTRERPELEYEEFLARLWNQPASASCAGFRV